jgi:hypothetical protein
MTKNKTQYLLFACVIVSTFFGYFLISTYVVDISFGKYLLIELIISILHDLYNHTKRKAVKYINHE